MLGMTAAFARIKGRAAEAVPGELIARLSREVGHRWRDRDLGPVVTTHLFLRQVLEGNVGDVILAKQSGNEVDKDALPVLAFPGQHGSFFMPRIWDQAIPHEFLCQTRDLRRKRCLGVFLEGWTLCARVEIHRQLHDLKILRAVRVKGLRPPFQPTVLDVDEL